MRSYIVYGLGLAFMLVFVAGAASAQDCPVIVQTALETAGNACADMGRNQACYGNVQLTATGRGDTFTFSQVGDMENVANIQSLALSALNEDGGTWGVAMMNVQARLPDTLPGQGVRVLLFGDVTLENAVTQAAELPVYANANTRLRSSPSSANDFNILAGVPAGTEMIANGRIESGEWLRVTLPAQSGTILGWIAALVVDGDAERMTLPVVAIDEPLYDPMQAFYLSTGIGAVNCAQLPPDGIVIQTPEGAGNVEFLVNGVKINLGSTAFLQTMDNTLSVAVIEGKGIVSAAGAVQFVPPGTQTTVELSVDGRAPVGPPSFPAPYDFDRLSALPVQPTAATALVPEPVAVAQAVPEAEVEAAIVATFADNDLGLVPGWYAVSVISFEQVVPNPFSDGYCRSGGTVLNYLHTEFSEGWDWSIIRRESISSFTFTNDNSAPELGGCIVEHRAVWTPEGPR